MIGQYSTVQNAKSDKTLISEEERFHFDQILIFWVSFSSMNRDYLDIFGAYNIGKVGKRYIQIKYSSANKKTHLNFYSHKKNIFRL